MGLGRRSMPGWRPWSGCEPVRPDARMVPVAAAAWAASWVATSSQAPWCRAAMLAGVVVLAAGIWRRWVWAVIVGIVVVGLLPAAIARDRALHTGPVATLAAERAVGTVEAELSSDLRHVAQARSDIRVGRATLQLVEARGRRVTQRVPVLVIVSGAQQAPPVGARFRVSARLEAPQPGDDIAAVVRIRSPVTVLTPAPAAQRAVEHVRAGLRTAVPPGRAGGLLPALVLGDTSLVDGADASSFRVAGLTHLTAVSGETTAKRGA